MDFDAEARVENEVNEGASCIVHPHLQGPFLHWGARRKLFSGSGHMPGQIPLDVQGAGELLCLIPGSDFGAAVRRRAVDALLRVEGGDESLIDRIKANRRFQEYLAQHDPDHPLRAVGEHAERRQVEEAIPEVHRR